MKEDKKEKTIIIILITIIVVLSGVIILLLTGIIKLNNENNKLDSENNITENDNVKDNWINKLLSYNISEIKLHRMRSKDLGDSQDINKEISLTKEELRQILEKINSNKLIKTYSLGRGGPQRDQLTVSYQVNNQNYTFQIYYSSISLDFANEELIDIFNNNNYEEKGTEYKNQEGSFYYYTVEGNVEKIFDEYFK